MSNIFIEKSATATLLRAGTGLVVQMRRFLTIWLVLLCLLPILAQAGVSSGGTGGDGAFNPTQNATIDMSDSPDGIFQYTSVNIPSCVTATFVPNVKNTPEVWELKPNIPAVNRE